MTELMCKVVCSNNAHLNLKQVKMNLLLVSKCNRNINFRKTYHRSQFSFGFTLRRAYYMNKQTIIIIPKKPRVPNENNEEWRKQVT